MRARFFFMRKKLKLPKKWCWQYLPAGRQVCQRYIFDKLVAPSLIEGEMLLDIIKVIS